MPSRKPVKISFDEWDAAIRDAYTERAEQVPIGWITADKLSQERDIGKHQAGCILVKLVQMGKAERHRFRIETATGRICFIWHYRLIKRSE